MAQNKNALIRYRTIDKCLQNRTKRWTLLDLIDACSDALYEYEGRDSDVSKRTIQLDIQMMRSDKLGYNAPIIVYDRKYYTYEDPDYKITDVPLDDLDMDILAESMEVLRQFKDFSLFSELQGIIQKLEDKVFREKEDQDPIIHLEKNEHLKGLHHLDTLYQSIAKKIVLKIRYRSFKSRDANDIIIHPYILKEFNNRWFLVGRAEKKDNILTLALDRVEAIDYVLSIDHLQENFSADRYYRDTIGVTVLSDSDIIDIELWIDRKNAPYVLTKPFHPSQQLLCTNSDHSIRISLQVHHNYELERLLLGFGESLEVIRPRKLRNRIRWKMRKALERYDDHLGPT